MKHYWLVISSLLLLLLAAVVIFEQLQIPILVKTHEYVETASIEVAFLSILLLMSDIFLPIPSSFVMTANGYLFGVWIGTLISVIGALSAACIGFYVGRRGEPFLQRFISSAERQRADYLLSKWGTLTIILTRPLPLLAEATVIIAGTSSMTWRHLWMGTALGTLPTALVYAIAGAWAISLERQAVALGLVLVSAGLFFIISERWGRVDKW